MSTPPLLQATGLHTYYGNSHVLHGVDLSIRAGEAVSLIGRNGMGKSTTLRSLVGLTPPRRGQVRVDGQDVTGQPAHRIARLGIAYVPEDRGIFPNLSVLEHLQMAARPGLDGRDDWNLDRVLALFPRIHERLRHMGNQLSGGEQQMLTVGRALMTNPRLILLDEATEGLAPLIRRTIWEVIAQIKAAGIATVVVDKDINALLRITDRNTILSKGRVVYCGETAELAANRELLDRHLAL